MVPPPPAGFKADRVAHHRVGQSGALTGSNAMSLKVWKRGQDVPGFIL
jgi:hypothetical protein